MKHVYDESNKENLYYYIVTDNISDLGNNDFVQWLVHGNGCGEVVGCNDPTRYFEKLDDYYKIVKWHQCPDASNPWNIKVYLEAAGSQVIVPELEKNGIGSNGKFEKYTALAMGQYADDKTKSVMVFVPYRCNHQDPSVSINEVDNEIEVKVTYINGVYIGDEIIIAKKQTGSIKDPFDLGDTNVVLKYNGEEFSFNLSPN